MNSYSRLSVFLCLLQTSFKLFPGAAPYLLHTRYFTLHLQIYPLIMLQSMLLLCPTADPAFIPQVPTVHQSFCVFQPISPEEALEEENILKSIAWPKTSSMTSLKKSSNPKCSKFTILPKMGGGQWYIGDQLEVSIIMKDYNCHPKTSGGDFLVASLKNQNLQAGVSGQVIDHLNGSYTAVFLLVWEGQADVILVHSSEAVTVLKRLNRENPDRVSFKSVFRLGSVAESTVCNICLQPTVQPVCNFTDVRTGEPWFCLKPKNLSCDTRIQHSKGDYLLPLKTQEDKPFMAKINLKVPVQSSGSSSVTVYQKSKDQPTDNNSNSIFRPSGFYYKGVWESLGSKQIYKFDAASIIQCLRRKMVHLYGDSTVRQWFDYLTKIGGNYTFLKPEFNPQTQKTTGPRLSLDLKNRILLHYNANKLDSIMGGSNTVVALSVWAHFGNFPLEIYIRRLLSIRRAVLRLLTRAPDTLVVIRGGNPRALSLSISIFNSNWYSLQCNKALKAMFQGMNVHLVDAWEMTLAHSLPHNIHPPPPIIKNMVNVLCLKMHNSK
uniref:Neurexophilin and PC-esterase domain family, member 3 n=1 Tax=Gouania willdenowi TaxID=441366 RepID=A0A8C5HT32_GOUWI